MRLIDNLWELYNQYSFKGVMIISYESFKKEIERIIKTSEKVDNTNNDKEVKE